MADTLAGNPDTVTTYAGGKPSPAKTQMAAIMEKANAKRVYDTPDKGILWGWEVSGYVFTKAISAGAILVLFLAHLMNVGFSSETNWLGLGLGLGFLTLTGALLVKDLDQPLRFVYVILRPQWRSWLVRGGYAITVFGGLLTLWGVALFFDINALATISMWVAAALAVVVAVYTAFLFAQAKGRDFWQSPTLPIHMFIHSVMAGAGSLAIGNLLMANDTNWGGFLENILLGTLIANVILLVVEMGTTHPTADAKATVHMIMKGRYKNRFWGGVVFFGNLLPIAMVAFGVPVALTAVVALIGIILQEKIWVEAPQRLPLA
jgi:formate-dependent nitrite reductase membrane component NrfD